MLIPTAESANALEQLRGIYCALIMLIFRKELNKLGFERTRIKGFFPKAEKYSIEGSEYKCAGYASMSAEEIVASLSLEQKAAQMVMPKKRADYEKQGIGIISMRDDFKTIYGDRYVPRKGMEPFFVMHSFQIGQYTGMTKGGTKIDHGWNENDGRVSTISEVSPFGAPNKRLEPDNINPDIWNVYPVYNGDHMSLQGGLLHKLYFIYLPSSSRVSPNSR